MFTGIIREVGILKSAQKTDSGLVIAIKCKKTRIKEGNSISVNGACLTISKKLKNGFEADIVNETLRRTNLGQQKIGAKLNLEPSLKIGDSLDGHFVTGHVDATGKVLKNGAEMVITFPQNLAPFIVEKGSVAVNGVSVTVANVHKHAFAVALIPFTKAQTNLGNLKHGDSVNLEVDLIARYLFNFKNK